jgi:alkaline phosphatase D
MRLDMSSLPFTDYDDSIFNIDAWAGYPHELGYMVNHLREQEVTGLVSLSGDHHMHGAGTVNENAGKAESPPVFVDFNVAGISSTPLFDDLLVVAKRDHPDFGALVYRETDTRVEPVWNMSMLQGVFAAYTYNKTGIRALSDLLGPNNANPGLLYVDTLANGYGLASLDGDTMRVRLVAMEDCRDSFEQPPRIRYIASFTLDHWGVGEAPEVKGPTFDGTAPFPFRATSV